ncbi:MAG: DUF4112 domain-containing protein [Actinobacteria bacterium]|uniref:Unannotated protein n=1 Tax=freshwater metagenome TaxID=449393 RepID=A0A6J6QCM2_9ZZZZ|nr:DUF4112 domain-containing protein [Actinomycetota bacterium]MSV84383.1 DUF4112 domain-containing protein [Actinomycetota bacterium]MSY22494.1 DUF4112 domain-containing protein [Actinomycetota bacterium]MTA74441.1 DUF4112 domain-containing protein [Actinomycetota bacterium]
MNSEPRDVGPIEGREVPQTQAEFSEEMQQFRKSRSKGRPNSRPLPSWVERLAWILDSAFRVPGTTDRRVGIDGLLTLVPVVGDAAGVALSMAVVLAGVAAGVSVPTLLRMLINVGIEATIGLIPFAGAVFDMVYKANIRNLVLMERDLADRRATRRSSLAVLALMIGVIFLGLLMVVLAWFAAIGVLVWFFTRLF